MSLGFWTLLLLFIRPALQKFCSEFCGVADESRSATPEVLAQDEADSSTRIVNGWDAPPRPWMVLLRATNPDNPDDYDSCGATLINDRFVLTAGHCVCLLGSRLTPCEFGKINYDPGQILSLYIGLNGEDLNRALDKHRSHYEYLIEQVIIHPGWTGEGVTSPDLALIKTKKPVQMRLNMTGGGDSVMPICMGWKGGSIYEKDGYVAGWGLTRNIDCFTDNFGPERHVKCRFPFIYKGLQMNDCIQSQSPSSEDVICRQYRAAMGDFNSSILIRFDRGRRRSVCYPERRDPDYGWCGVCLKNAKYGEYGYCPLHFPPPEEDELITVVKPSKHWGYCSKLCTQDSFKPKRLQETKLTIISETDCQLFNNSKLMYHPSLEFCAGKKHSYPKLKIFKRYKLRKGSRLQSVNSSSKYIFKHQETKRNSLGADRKHLTLNYYLGGSDSCQGDSGGPFYLFHGGKAHLVGVVSRGGHCAGFNQPGVYTNLLHKPWLEWIEQNSKEGQC